MFHFSRRIALALVIGASFVAPVHADWLDILKGKPATSNAVGSATALSTDEITKGLKEALAKGTERAVANLGKTNGFLQNVDVKIPMPDSLRTIEKGLRAVQQDKIADEFILTMNRAAEAAVPESAAIFSAAIREMTLEDAKNILNGPDDAATQYFRKVGEPRLREKMLLIVKQATEKTGVTANYKKFMAEAGPVTSFFKKDDIDIDQYVTAKAMDGLFLMIGREEKEIRKNPVARSTDLLKKVFGSAGK
jgi:hypothetical protein